MAGTVGNFHSPIELGEHSWRWERSGNDRPEAPAGGFSDAVLWDDAGDVIARVRAGVISMTNHELLLEHSASSHRFHVRATSPQASPQGTVYTLSQTGFSVSHLRAECGGRVYNVERVNPFRRGRSISSAAGQHLLTAPTFKGEFIITAPAAAAPITCSDAVFITYGCLLIDGPAATRLM